MKIRFEGYGKAAELAEKESRGEKERWVLKSIEGGINYCVVASLDFKVLTDKVMAHYKNGQIVK